MDFSEILKSKKWTPLEEIVGATIEADFVGKSLYKVSEQMYLQVSQFKGRDLLKDDSAPYVTGVFLTPGDGAARRITSLAIEEDAGEKLVLSKEMLPDNLVADYGSILVRMKKESPETCQETASYRIATDGKFVHRTIETDKYVFYFRENKNNNSEEPYAVLYKLQS